MSYTRKSFNRDNCDRCLIIEDCQFPSEFAGMKCPCRNCLVKMVCGEGVYCKLFEIYVEYYRERVNNV